MGGGDGGARAHPAGSRGDGVATRRWSGKRRWGWSLESKRGKRSEREVEGTVARVVGAEREWGVRTPTGTAPPSFIQRSGRLVEVVVRAPQPRQLETRVPRPCFFRLLVTRLSVEREG